jgi:hypothetical protein
MAASGTRATVAARPHGTGLPRPLSGSAGSSRYTYHHWTDGPKVSLGVAWFVVLMAAAYLEPRLLLAVLVPLATVAAYQIGHAWSLQELTDRRLGAAVGCVVTAAAWFGPVGLGLACVLGTATLVGYAYIVGEAVLDVGTTPAGGERLRFAELVVRAALPGAVAAGSLSILAVEETSAFVAVVLLVSAYEIGDFLVGSGSANGLEGPIAGLVAMAVVSVGLYLVLPDPFTNATLPLFAAVVALGAPLGQIAGSALLPRGDMWAPALRRLDSYLLVAPLWLLFL